MYYLLRRRAQKEAAKPKNGFNNETCCKTITHASNYTNKTKYCNIYFKNSYFIIQNMLFSIDDIENYITKRIDIYPEISRIIKRL